MRNPLALLAAIALLTACASPAPDSAAHSSKSEGSHGCAPTAADYPLDSRAAHEEGDVTLRFTVEPDSTLGRVEVVKSSGYKRLDAVSIGSLYRCKFKAGRDKDGHPIGGTFNVTYEWHLS